MRQSTMPDTLLIVAGERLFVGLANQLEYKKLSQHMGLKATTTTHFGILLQIPSVSERIFFLGSVHHVPGIFPRFFPTWGCIPLSKWLIPQLYVLGVYLYLYIYLNLYMGLYR